jgi:hypothetical protein
MNTRYDRRRAKLCSEIAQAVEWLDANRISKREFDYIVASLNARIYQLDKSNKEG